MKAEQQPDTKDVQAAIERDAEYTRKRYDEMQNTIDQRNTPPVDADRANAWHVHDMNPYLVYSGRRRIADCREAGCVCYTAEDQASARLIAAAPELLAVCKAIAATVDGLDMTAELWDDLHAVIAKAEGSAQ